MRAFPIRPVFGIDFSGAADAGRKIWVAEAAQTATHLVVRSVLPIAARSPGALGRDAALRELRALVTGSGAAAFGLDAPPSLPTALMPNGWDLFIASFAARFADPAAFRAWAWQASGGRELRRATDIASGTPFAATNLRLYRQTFYAIRDLIAPLVLARAARVVPFETPDPALPLLAEVCPAATLKRLGWYKPPYKGRDRQSARANLLQRLSEHYRLTLDPADAARCVADAEGDAIDSLIAACALAAWLQNPAALADPARAAAVEGFVYT